MKVFISGRWDQRHEIQKRMEELRRAGYEITHDWTVYRGAAYMKAEADLEGIKAADVLISLMDDPKYAYRGTFTEMGAALALGKPIFVVSPPDQDDAYYMSNCFYHHPNLRHFPTWESLWQQQGGKFIPGDVISPVST